MTIDDDEPLLARARLSTRLVDGRLDAPRSCAIVGQPAIAWGPHTAESRCDG